LKKEEKEEEEEEEENNRARPFTSGDKFWQPSQVKPKLEIESCSSSAACGASLMALFGRRLGVVSHTQRAMLVLLLLLLRALCITAHNMADCFLVVVYF